MFPFPYQTYIFSFPVNDIILKLANQTTLFKDQQHEMPCSNEQNLVYVGRAIYREAGIHRQYSAIYQVKLKHLISVVW
jgi:hypothetical protein